MEDAPDPEARETLARLEERLRRDVHDMVEVLRADVPVFFRRAVKAAFEESPGADALDGAAVRRLKRDAERRAEEVARALTARLEPLEVWRWSADAPPPREARGLDEHPGVGPALLQVGAALRALLEEHGLSADAAAERLTYRLPTYFVAGHFMKSLVESFWQTLTLHHELAGQMAAGAEEDRRQARRARWDEA